MDYLGNEFDIIVNDDSFSIILQSKSVEALIIEELDFCSENYDVLTTQLFNTVGKSIEFPSMSHIRIRSSSTYHNENTSMYNNANKYMFAEETYFLTIVDIISAVFIGASVIKMITVLFW